MDHPYVILRGLRGRIAPLKVAVVTETWPPEINGVSLTIARLVRGLVARGHRVQLVRPRQQGDAAVTGDDGIEQVLVAGLPIPGYSGLRMGLPARRALTRLWAEHSPDVVHVVTEGPLGWSALKAARRLGIPVASDFHTNFHAYSRHYGIGLLQRPIEGYLRRLHNEADCTMVPTAAMRRELAAAGYQRLQVVARGVDCALFSPARRSAALRASWGLADGALAVGYVGRIAPEKNLPLLLRGFEEIRRARPDARLVLVGDGPARRPLQAKGNDYVFAGMRTGEDLAAHYASCDVFLFPSVTETFGNVTLEAMASGLAVVAYDYAAAAAHIRHQVNGLLAGFDDEREFIARCAWIGAQPERIGALGQAARETALGVDWSAVCARFESVLTATANGDIFHESEDRVPLAADH